jgi:hypothetical protein
LNGCFDLIRRWVNRHCDRALQVVGSDPHGLPLGVQVIGPRFREDLCLDAGAALESAFGTLTPIDPR